jgi:hypothetical protein
VIFPVIKVVSGGDDHMSLVVIVKLKLDVMWPASHTIGHANHASLSIVIGLGAIEANEAIRNDHASFEGGWHDVCIAGFSVGWGLRAGVDDIW